MKRTIFLIIIGVLLMISFFTAGTYAIWYKTQIQEDSNIVKSECLDISYSNESAAITLTNAYPIKYKKGMQSTPYTFRVTNHCDREIPYHVLIDSLKISGNNVSYLQNQSVAVSYDFFAKTTLDHFRTYSEYDTKTVRNSHLLETKYVAPNSYNEHSIKLWVDEKVTTAEQNKQFEAKMRIVAGQNVVREEANAECFGFDSTSGTIYSITIDNTGCNVLATDEEIIIPRYINGVKVTTLGNSADSLFSYNPVVTIPDTVTSIGDMAFDSNTAIERFNLSRGLDTIGFLGLYTGSWLESVVLPDTVTTLMVLSVAALNYLEIPDSVTYMDSEAIDVIGEIKINKTQQEAEALFGSGWYTSVNGTVIYNQ